MPESSRAPRWKRAIARCSAWPPVPLLLRAGIRLVAPRHRIGAVVAVLDDQRRVLLVEHCFHPGEPWGLPGGWVKRGESPVSAARREIVEETSLEVEIGPPVHIERVPDPWHVNIAYVGRLLGGELRLGGELLNAAWIDCHSLPDGMSPFVLRAVAAAAALSW